MEDCISPCPLRTHLSPPSAMRWKHWLGELSGVHPPSYLLHRLLPGWLGQRSYTRLTATEPSSGIELSLQRTGGNSHYLTWCNHYHGYHLSTLPTSKPASNPTSKQTSNQSSAHDHHRNTHVLHQSQKIQSYWLLLVSWVHGQKDPHLRVLHQEENGTSGQSNTCRYQRGSNVQQWMGGRIVEHLTIWASKRSDK